MDEKCVIQSDGQAATLYKLSSANRTKENVLAFNSIQTQLYSFAPPPASLLPSCAPTCLLLGLASNSPSTMHTLIYLVLDRMSFLGVFNQIPFPEVALTVSLHTALHKAREGGVVMDAAHVICALALDLKGKLVVGTVWQSAEELHSSSSSSRGVGVILLACRGVVEMRGSQMLGEMIFPSKRIDTCVLIALRTWEFGGSIPVPFKVVKTSIVFATFALKGIVVERFGVALELGG